MIQNNELKSKVIDLLTYFHFHQGYEGHDPDICTRYHTTEDEGEHCHVELLYVMERSLDVPGAGATLIPLRFHVGAIVMEDTDVPSLIQKMAEELKTKGDELNAMDPMHILGLLLKNTMESIQGVTEKIEQTLPESDPTPVDDEPTPNFSLRAS